MVENLNQRLRQDFKGKLNVGDQELNGLIDAAIFAAFNDLPAEQQKLIIDSFRVGNGSKIRWLGKDSIAPLVGRAALLSKLNSPPER